ncbi:MAG: hypothetical protein ACOX2T_04095 [bacterium]|jgi:hypothetical protein
MLTFIYRALIAVVLFFIVVNVWKEKDIRNQAVGVIVIVPLLLRLLMVK